MRFLRRIAVALTMAASAVFASQDASAAVGAWAENDQGKLRLVSATDGMNGSQDLRLGLHFRMAGDWKIYWRSPGDAGYPPEIDWSDSENLVDAEMLWPIPERFQLFGLQTFGYGDDVVLPIRAVAENPSEPVKLRGEVGYLVCEEICIPHTERLSLDLRPGEGGPSEAAYLIDRFRAQVPGSAASAGMSLEKAVLTEGGETPELTVRVASDSVLSAPDVIVEEADGYRFGAPEVRLENGGEHAVLRVSGQRGFAADAPLEGQTVTLTVFDGKRGFETRVTLEAGSLGASGSLLPVASAGGGGPSVGAAELAGLIAIAVLGGLILNLMPCVLPVLSLKLLSVVGQGGRPRGEIRAGFLASAAGILFSFLVLAAGAIALKTAGVAVGWGIQFQQPLFLVAMIVVLTLFASNLFGFFEVRLPRALADAPDRTGGTRHGLSGHFATGAFATLLATPCSAPFVGTAVAFALSRGSGEILAIFLAMGLGLALPYLAVAAMPGAAALLPRPGRWMLVLRRVLAVALAGTGVWLLTVLAAQDGALAATVVAVLMVMLSALLWARRAAGPQLRRAVPGVALLVAAAAFAAPPVVGSQPIQEPSGPAEAAQWATLDESRIPDLVEEGKVVFVDVTADWCITCQVNKRAVLDNGTVRTELERGDVVRMRGDWTLPDPAISDYLARFDRYGIPFNVVYGPHAPEGIALPEILTTSAVMDAVKTAREG